jgi:O-acetyl-ADP-ribose deacetylase (regulator of RNase III)
MPGSEGREFLFLGPADTVEGGTLVKILIGDILHLPGDVQIDAVVSTDDNYLTMASGYSENLRKHTLGDPKLGGDPAYVREAQKECPVEAGTVVVTGAYGLADLLGVSKVLHGTVIDYDHEMDYAGKCELVERTTANCLLTAEELHLSSILLPAFATGAGQLEMADCARAMCHAIKSYLALDRPLEKIYIVLYDGDPQEKRDAYIREAELILGVPYDPERDGRQVRDFYGRDKILEAIEEIITGKCENGGKKRHAVILGGPSAGKGAILDQIYRRAQQAGSPLSKGRRVVRLSFGAIHDRTPKTFVYRKFYHSLAEDLRQNGLRNAEGKPLEEEHELLDDELAELYADSSKATKDDFIKFLEKYDAYYPELIFLVDKLPRLLRGEDEKDERSIINFWADLDKLQDRVRFVYTAREDEEYEKLVRDRFSETEKFREQIETVYVPCISKDERKDWVNELFESYLKSEAGAPPWADQFLEREAGRHPYLISLLGYILVRKLKERLLKEPDAKLGSLEPLLANRICEEVLREAEESRRAFFGRLINFLRMSEEWKEYRFELETLATAIAIEEGRKSLMQFLMVGDPNAVTEMMELEKEGDARQALHRGRLGELYNLGYLAGTVTSEGGRPTELAEDSAQFMSDSFASYVLGILVGRVGPHDQPADMTIGILAPTCGWMRTVFCRRGARAIEANQPLGKSERDRFMESFRDFISLRFSQQTEDAPSAPLFVDTDQIGKHILSQFATIDIRRNLWNAPRHSTVIFMIDESLADLPWELMLEATYAGEIPFRVGRIIIGERAPQSVLPPVRGIGKVRALLIGNPSDDPNLRDAGKEVEELEKLLMLDQHRDLFEKPKVLIGGRDDCRSIRLLQELSSGRYGLVHYSGHAEFAGSNSAWVVGDGLLTTHELTKAIQSGPPVMVICSACWSAKAGAAEAPRYEGQSFDLPGAFLQAGVEAYIGALWPVDSDRSWPFFEKFYSEFLKGKHNLGECLRLAKWASKQDEESVLAARSTGLSEPGEGRKMPTPINWLAFVLYGDPRVMPGDLFTAMANPEHWVP